MAIVTLNIPLADYGKLSQLAALSGQDITQYVQKDVLPQIGGTAQSPAPTHTVHELAEK